MKNAQTAYEYTRKSYDAVIRARSQNLERVNKLLLTISVLFTALSYGVSQLVSLDEIAPWEIVVGCVLGAVSGVALSLALCCGIRLLKIDDVAVPCTDRLATHVDQPYFPLWDNDTLLASLTKNVEAAVQDTIRDDQWQARWFKWFNCSLLFGIVAAIAFMAFVLAVRAEILYAAHDKGGLREPSALKSEDQLMSEKNPNPPASGPQPGQPAASEPAATQPAASAPAAAPPADAAPDPGPAAVIGPPIHVKASRDHGTRKTGSVPPSSTTNPDE